MSAAANANQVKPHTYPCKCMCVDFDAFLASHDAFNYQEEYDNIQFLMEHRIWDEALIATKELRTKVRGLYKFMTDPSRVKRNTFHNICKAGNRLSDLTQRIDKLKTKLQKKEEEAEQERSIRRIIELRKKQRNQNK